jgi:uncharacterized protein YjiS (DUF1127 family)
MAYASSNTSFAQTSFVGRFAPVMSSMYTRFVRNAAEAGYRRELSRLNDRELADIGINRADIPAIAREAVQS